MARTYNHSQRFAIRDSRSGTHQFRGLRFWAERGLIHIEHQRTGDYEVVQVSEWQYRFRALLRQVARMDQYADERDELIRGLEAMQACGRTAMIQGDPHNAIVMDYLLRHNRNQRVSTANLPHIPGIKDAVLVDGFTAK